jgi:hypothetical protein
MDNTESKERMKRLILLGKERGYLTHAEIREAISHPSPPLHPQYADPQWRKLRIGQTVMDEEQLEAIAETFNDMGIEVRQ